MCYRPIMFRRVLSGLFVAALALAGAVVVPVRAASGGLSSVGQTAVAPPGRAELRVIRAETRAAHPQLLALLPAIVAPQRPSTSFLTTPDRARPRLSVAAGAPHGARAPPA